MLKFHPKRNEVSDVDKLSVSFGLHNIRCSIVQYDKKINKFVIPNLFREPTGQVHNTRLQVGC